MTQPPPEEPREPEKTVLEFIARTTGMAPKVLLPDTDSEHGVSPMLDPGAKASKLVPQGRGNYQIMGEIARGGMGLILKGHDTDLGRDVALKVLHEEARRPAGHPAALRRGGADRRPAPAPRHRPRVRARA